MVDPVEPIALVGLACRLPMAADADAFWRLLSDGTSAVIDAPASRWSPSALPAFRRAAFLDSVDTFDAELFDIPAAEARAMDPQQRLVLELAWHALEDARLRVDLLRGRRVGAFTAASNQDYALLTAAAGTSPDQHTYAGGQRSLMANRVSYLLGLRGPSLSVDTGQSSSLAAVHLACESLRSGESELALVGAANLNLRAETTAAIGEFGALSPDGVCRVLDAGANGYVRGEGGAVVVLKRLRDALADGDRVRCLVLGSAVNNDGGGETLTDPTVAAQRAVIEEALARAGRDAHDVDYVELHGTGTRRGDPVEATALGQAIGAGRRTTPLTVGSVKTNIGHLEGAAGLAGLVKVALSLEHAELVPTLNHDTPHPDVDLPALGLEVVTAGRPWPTTRNRLAGVSSFGMGGTNAHVLLGEAPASVADDQSSVDPTGPGHPLPWLLSAASGAALREVAGSLALLDAEDDAVADALASARTPLRSRAVCLGSRREAAAALAHGRQSPDLVLGTDRGGRCAFVFPGQGSQWSGMARELLATSASFSESLEACADALAPFTDHSVLDVLREVPGAPGLERVDVVQPALWAVMVALADQWRAAGVHPDLVLGHSQGEIAAATVAGALSLQDGARVVALRSRAIASIAGSGGMLSVNAGAAIVEQAITEHAPGATIAAVNSPRTVVVSGSSAELAELQGRLTVSGYRARLVPVDYASHSAAVDCLRPDVVSALAGVTPRAADCLLVSSLTGELIDTTTMDAAYWFEGLRRQVRFGPAVEVALAHGARVLVECSPHPVLAAALEETLESRGVDGIAVPTLRRDRGGTDELRRALALGHVSGLPVDWRVPTGSGRTAVDLPAYPLQRRRYWFDEVEAPATAVRVEALGPDQALALVLDVTADVLGRPEVVREPADQAFKKLGVTSIDALEIRNRLRQATAQPLPVGVLFERPSPALLAGLLHQQSQAPAPLPATPAVVTGPAGPAVDDPIAIVGMACRLPGDVTDPEELWQLVMQGRDVIGGFPTDRGWDLARLLGTDGQAPASATAAGGFVRDAAAFDAGFFDISPREAAAMDPQQRLLLTAAWEALEQGGIDPVSLQGSDTGVFAGGMAPDYGPRLHADDVAGEGHLLTGSALSVLSGRLAYVLGLQGPALTVDTACSSSLVALHLAVQALRRGECGLALAGGVTVMSTPGMFVEFSRQGGLSPDGHCKAFSAAADGTGWSEGVGMLVLQRLSDAQREGRTVLGVVRGTAVNQDGRSNGLTAPNGSAQERVIRSALVDAGLTAGEVDAVEAHGTGTRLGDPIEAQALANTYGAAHDADHPLWLGSLKSNLGHTQAAAGVASIIKMVQALRHETLPRTLHAADPTSHVSWDSSGLRLLTDPVRLDPARPTRIGVSGFGISGTNAHVVLETAPSSTAEQAVEQEAGPPEPVRPGHRPLPIVWAFSARTADALARYASALAVHAADAPDLEAAARALAGRSRFEHRAVVVAPDRATLREALDALAEGRSDPRVTTGHAATAADCVLVFPGQGSQWIAMGRELLDDNEVFWESMCECEGALAPHVDWSVLDVVRCEPDAPALEGAEIVQPVLFSVMVSLARVWTASGIDPSAVLGHSQGEIAAACVAGAVSLDDAARLVVHRSRALSQLGDTGGMLALPVAAARAAELVAPWEGRLEVAIHSSPEATVIGGDHEALAAFETTYADVVHARRVAIGYAAHTRQIDWIEDELRAAGAQLASRSGDLRIVSSLTAGEVDGAALDGGHWYRGLRHPVLFSEAVAHTATLVRRPLFIEVSPHPVLTAHVEDVLHAAGVEGHAVSTLRRDRGGWSEMLSSLARAYVAGAPIDWTRWLPAGPRGEDVPTYPFAQRRYWITEQSRLPDGLDTSRHPLVDAVLRTPDGGLVATGTLAAARPSWGADHVVDETAILPGAATIELVLALTAEIDADGVPWEVAELMIVTPLRLDAAGATRWQLHAGPAGGDGTRTVAIHAQEPGEAGWTTHAEGTVRPSLSARVDDAGSWPPAGAVEIAADDAYPRLADRGYHYGPAFQGLRRCWRTAEGLAAEVSLPEAVDGPAAAGHLVHPALLDACLHPHVLEHGADGPLLPFAWEGVRVHRTGQRRLRVRLTSASPERLSLRATDADGRLVVEVDDLALRPAPRGESRTGAGDRAAPRPLLEIDWVPVDSEPVDPAGRHWAVVGDDWELLDSLTRSGAQVADHLDLLALPALALDPAPELVVAPVAAPDLGDPAEEARLVALQALELVQTFLASDYFDRSRLLLLTDLDLAGSTVWGLVRSAQTEHPGRLAVASLDAAVVAWDAVAGALADGESQLLTRDGVLVAPRLAPVTGPPDPNPATLDPDRTVVITGGTRGLGALVAAHVVEAHGARRLLLISRTGRPGSEELVASLEALGATVTVAAADVADRRSLARALALVDPQHPVGLVVHAAGITADGAVAALTPRQLEEVLAVKVDGAVHLRELTREHAPERFLLFSSVAGVLGSAGQANYAAANAGLDALARDWRAHGLAATSVSWGLWDHETGLSATLGPADRSRLARAGIGVHSTAHGFAHLDAALASDQPHVIAATVSLGGLDPDISSPVLRSLAPAAPTRPVPASSGTSSTPEPGEEAGAAAAATETPWSTLSQAQVRKQVLELVRSEVATVLGYAGAHEIAADQGFADLGLDSLTVVELRNRLGVATGLRLPATLAFDHPHVGALAEHLTGHLAPDAPPPHVRLSPVLAEMVLDAGPGERAALASLLRDTVTALERVPTGAETETWTEPGLAAGLDISPESRAESRAEDITDATDHELFEFLDSTAGRDTGREPS